ncbi:hypothetical protein RRG08_017085 [Elysia crispata]|uniref:Serine/threonine-protein kinase PLK4 n=1 Tax=Elysia crispata TaxID=231223 RepID=A0AAE0ZV61_9GAST|nr:hypothetical protein RRG08_017085 [Elysia crispata]
MEEDVSLDDYQVLNLLGKGGFACVYRACSNKTGLEVAVKMIDKKMMKAASMNARVKKEVEIHSRLKHPSILELYNFFEDSNYVYLVLEMCHNGELQRYLRTQAQPFSEDAARRIMRQIVEGILYLHSHGILHRDLSLSNLLLTKNNDVKIADFGLATQLQGPEEKHFTMCGTPNYISPEIAMRSAHGLEADVWSLGCMLYTLLVGHAPFDTDAVKSTLNRVILAEYHLPDNLSRAACDLIQALLQKNPKNRLPLREILAHPFMTMKSGNKRVIQKMSEMSIDSGRGTLAYGKFSIDTAPVNHDTKNKKAGEDRNDSSPHAFHDVQQYHQANRQAHPTSNSQDQNSSRGKGNRQDLSAAVFSSCTSACSDTDCRKPSSPPVRERDSMTEEELQRTRQAIGRQLSRDHQGKSHGSDFLSAQHGIINSRQSSQHMPTLAPKEKYDPKGGGTRDQQHRPQKFDPSKYSGDEVRSHNSSPGIGTWSVSASLHSQSGSFFDYNTSGNPTSISSNTANTHIEALEGTCNNTIYSHHSSTDSYDPTISPTGSYDRTISHHAPQESSVSQQEITGQSCGGAAQPSLQHMTRSRHSQHPHHPGSVSSDQRESDLSLKSFHKAIDFESDSKLSSLHEKQDNQQALIAYPENFQTQELLAKVQNYLGQHCLSPHPSGGPTSGKRQMPTAAHDGLPIQFSSPESAQRAVHLTSRELQKCMPEEVQGRAPATNMSSPQSDSTRSSGQANRQDSGGRELVQERLVAPLNTERLRPIRQRTKNVVVHILENGEVCVEFIKRKGQNDIVMEVLYISSDGQRMNTFQPNDGQRAVVSEQPQPLPSSCKQFDFSSIPQKYVKKYQYAARFVTLIKSKTPKVTVYTRKAKCMLMENHPDPDFTAEFYDGSKFSSGAKGIKIVEKDGTSLTLESTEVNSRLSVDTKDMLHYVKQCRQQCVQLESVISSVQFSTDQLFPVIVGRRPDKSTVERSGSSTNSNRSEVGVGDTHTSTLKSQVQMSAFEGTLLSTTDTQTFNNSIERTAKAQQCQQKPNTAASTTSSTSSSSSNCSSRRGVKADRPTKAGNGRERSATSSHHQSRPSNSPSSAALPVLQQMFVSDIGWASQTAGGEVWVRFQDGTQLGVKSTATTVTYVDATGCLYRYREFDPLPEAVKSKLSKLPTVLEALKSTSQSQVHGAA